MKYLSKILSYGFVITVLAAVGYGLTHTQDLLDYVALRNYTPPQEIVAMADKTTMQDKTRKVFYINRPELKDKSTFTAACTQQEETIVLGCFVENDGIYLLKISDPRLEGIVEVTAAHEVLHAMYDRLDEGERKRVDGLTAKYFETLTDERIRQNIENYRKRDANVVPNELHSILGTEVRDLSPELEDYYSQYFKDRKAVVAISEKYESTFVGLETQAKQYDADLKAMKASLDSNEAQISLLGGQIDDKRTELDQLLSSGRVSEYNSEVAGFNGLVNQYNSLVRSRQAEVARYNQVVEEYNKIATTEAELYDSLKAAPALIDSATGN